MLCCAGAGVKYLGIFVSKKKLEKAHLNPEMEWL
jgi:hypothetical protein